jgi:hypothetical protein
MAREWWQRLPAEQRKVYERSAAIAWLPLAPGRDLADAVDSIESALAAEDRAATESAAQALVNRLCGRFEVPAVRVHVEGVRPHDRRGELHGLYVPANGRGSDRITVWMKTSKRHDVVAVKTFLRTLLHEICHHLDYSFLDLPYSFHTKGFYQRESSLLRVVARGTAHTPRRSGARRPGSTGKPDAEDEAPSTRRAKITQLRPARTDGGADSARNAPGESGLERLRAVAAAIAARKQPHERREGDDRHDRLEDAEAAGLAQPEHSIEAEDYQPRRRDPGKRISRDQP